jgi:Cof subfamily protein (haloacid dehalogenase superfamily)
MRHLQKELDILEHPLICYNGGLVLQYDAHGVATVLSSTQIPWQICSEILVLGQGKSVHMSLYVDDNWYAPGADQWTEREATITKVCPTLRSGSEVLAMWRQAQTGAHKIMIMGEAGEVKVLEGLLRAKFAEKIHVYHSKATYLELAPRTVSKASALKLLLEKVYKIGLPEVIAFGDNYNDIELLQSVGLGIAVGNARDEVKEAAKEITFESRHDGVAHALSKHLLFRK